MPSVISHAVVGVTAGVAFAPRDVPNHFLSHSIVCPMIPDADVIGFSFGIPYQHLFDRRGFFHSPFFGILMSILFVVLFFHGVEIFPTRWFFCFIFSFLVISGILDAFTSGGIGIALLAPSDNTRYFPPWRPIVASPMSVGAFFSKWGLMVIKSQLLWVWLLSFLIVVISRVIPVVAGALENRLMIKPP